MADGGLTRMTYTRVLGCTRRIEGYVSLVTAHVRIRVQKIRAQIARFISSYPVMFVQTRPAQMT